jgi:hypothetical protein
MALNVSFGLFDYFDFTCFSGQRLRTLIAAVA